MHSGNGSHTGFILLGFPSSRELQLLLFGVFLGFYLLTVSANILVIGIVSQDFTLRRIPMYIFLCHFSFLDIWYVSAIVPKMLVDFISNNNIISYSGCIIQIYFFFALGLTELFFLALMGYDRYLAICHPLHYTFLMASTVCRKMAVCCWICGFSTGFLLIIPTSRLLCCGSRIINHFFCDFIPLQSISCNKTFSTDVVFYAVVWIIIIYSCLLTMFSYVKIIMTIFRLPSQLGRKKAFSTCASHLTIVLTFYGTVFFMYIRPTTQYMLNMDKFVSVFYTVVIPLLNPLVYTLRNREFNYALRKIPVHCLLIWKSF